jgi:hypothetical protein
MLRDNGPANVQAEPEPIMRPVLLRDPAGGIKALPDALLLRRG